MISNEVFRKDQVGDLFLIFLVCCMRGEGASESWLVARLVTIKSMSINISRISCIVCNCLCEFGMSAKVEISKVKE